MTPDPVIPCKFECCDLTHPPGGEVGEPEVWFKLHASGHTHGAIRENVATGGIDRRITIGYDDQPTPAQLRGLADWLEAG